MHRYSRDPVAVGGDKRDGGALEALGDVGEPFQELGLDDEPEVALLIALGVVAQLLGELLLEVLLLVQHELGVRHQEVVRLWLLLLPERHGKSQQLNSARARAEWDVAGAESHLLGRLGGALLVGVNGDGPADATEGPRRVGDGDGLGRAGSGREPGPRAGRRGTGRRGRRAGAEGERCGSHHWLGLGWARARRRRWSRGVGPC
jgi:hypothetical protein